MCPPLIAALPVILAVASTAAAAGGAVLSYQQGQEASQAAQYNQQIQINNQIQQNNNQKAYQDSLMAQQNAQFLNQASAERLQQAQEREQLARESEKVQNQALQARATARTASGESGVSGQSVDALIGDFTRQEQNYYGTLDRQQKINDLNTDQNLEQQRMAVQFNNTQVNQPLKPIDYSYIPKPSFGALAIGLTGAALNGVGTYYQYKNTIPNPNKTSGSSTPLYGTGQGVFRN